MSFNLHCAKKWHNFRKNGDAQKCLQFLATQLTYYMIPTRNYLGIVRWKVYCVTFMWRWMGRFVESSHIQPILAVYSAIWHCHFGNNDSRTVRVNFSTDEQWKPESVCYTTCTHWFDICIFARCTALHRCCDHIGCSTTINQQSTGNNIMIRIWRFHVNMTQISMTQ